MLRQIFFGLLLIGVLPNVLAIDPDSLKSQTLENNPIDTRIKAMLNLSALYLRSDTTESKKWAISGMKLSQEELNVRGIILASETFARYYTEQGRYDSATFFLESVISSYDLPEFDIEIGNCYISKGNIHDIQSDYEQALAAYLKAEEKFAAKKYFHGLGLAQMGIGNIYNTTNMHQEAKRYFRMSYKNLLQTNEVYASWSMNNLATSMSALQEYDSAIFFFERSLEIKLRNQDFYGASYTYNDLGSLYFSQGDYEKALSYYLKALESKEALEGISRETLSNTCLDIARIYMIQEKYDASIHYGEIGLSHALAVGSIFYQAEAYRLLADVNAKVSNYKTGFEMLNQFIAIQDSLQQKLYNDNLADLRTKYDADQKQKEIELLNTSNKLSQLETEKANEKTEVVTMYLAGAVVIILLASFLGISLYRSNQAKNTANLLLQQTNEEVSHQKDIVEEKNKEITDSINYAKRIQNAILPSSRLVQSLFPESFILYKPKDIVAGDFYWFETKEDKILFAAADCTGHGVPGAMVSVICNNGLNRSVREHNLTDPGKILDKTREIVISEFEKSDEEVKDGMDISLGVFDPKTLKLSWAGANNPLWIIRKNTSEIEEIRPNKQPIGKYADARPFMTYDTQLQKGDRLYVFTDGFQDQFGGDRGKKFKANQLKEMLIRLKDEPLSRQSDMLNQVFETWRGKLEQVDDVCFIGIGI